MANVKKTETKPKTVKKTKVELSPIEQENQMLKQKLEQLEKMIMNLNTTSVTSTTNKVEVVEDKIEDDYIEIKPNKYIRIISLENNPLILSTQGDGSGKIFKFKNFGDTKNIVYQELVELIHHQQKFAEDGRFYIADRNVIKNHGLIDAYNRILKKETIESILELDKNQMVDVFKNATIPQRETIVSLIVDKLNAGENIDLNRVDALSRIYGKDISQLIEGEVSED